MRSIRKDIGAHIMRTACIAIVATAFAIDGAYAQSSDRTDRDFELGKSIEILANIMREFDMGHVDDIDASELLNAATTGMIAVTDPYSEYISEEAMADFEMMTTGRYAGVGSLIRKKGDYVLFAQPYKGSPSDEAGRKIGDKIL